MSRGTKPDGLAGYPFSSINSASQALNETVAPNSYSPGPLPRLGRLPPRRRLGRITSCSSAGPSLMRWEKYKGEAAHDHWWANFIRAARIRTEQIRRKPAPDVKITWLVYGTGYKDRAEQENQDLFASSARSAISLT